MNNFIEENFTKISFDRYEILFSNKNIDFKIDNQNAILNINRLKHEIGAKDIGFLKQVHSDIIVDYNGEIVEGDSLITDDKSIALGVFTADCVPILLCDEQKGIIAAVHSGWKGTEKNILGKTIDKMIKDYKCKAENISAFIGPHIQKCCYEVSEDLIEKFMNLEIYKGSSISSDRYLDLNACITFMLNKKGITEKNIHNTKICTYCDEKVGFHSYRRDRENAGRIISIVTLK